ncbi:MAG: general secretion pathway protein GspF [Gammaproteobacteria bacterium]|nr:general secretion pathway protein GspF [Gammaproteobacteria bacterium]
MRFKRSVNNHGLRPDQPLRINSHDRPRTRREFIAQGFMAGAGTVLGGSVLSLFANPRAAYAALSGDIATLRDSCGIVTQGAGKIPFICFDLAGGANIAGSNVLVGGPGGQEDFLSTAGYNRLGLPGDRIPSVMDPITGLSDFINRDLGLAFHSESQMLAGINEKLNMSAGLINGAVIPARSENDTGNNPHNPMYGINRAGSDGELLTLIGSRSADSGGNSMAPDMMINPSVRPTKVDRVSDVTGLVDTGQLVGLLDQADAVAVMESIQRVSDMKLGRVDTLVTADDVLKDLMSCGYVKAADLADRYGNPGDINPALDCNIVGPSGVFSQTEFDSDSEFRKTASIMKLVVNGYAGAGTVTMSGYDYHTGDRATGELRDLRAGRCIGACLEYAAKVGVPLMVYVFSDGSVFSNGMIDNSPNGGGKGVWTGDSSSTAASYMLVYNPSGAPQLYTSGSDSNPAEMHQQIGWMRSDSSVETASTPAANNVNLLVESVILNYMALHGEQMLFDTAPYFPMHGLGNAALMDSLIAFEAIAPGGQINPAPPSSCPGA